MTTSVLRPRVAEPVFSEDLCALGLDAESAQAVQQAVQPWWRSVESFPYHALLATFHLDRLSGEPMIAVLRRAITRGAVDPEIGFHLIDIVADVAVETQRPMDPELETAPRLSHARELRKRQLQVAYLRRSGEDEMAGLLEGNPDAYYAASDKGRRKLAKRYAT